MLRSRRRTTSHAKRYSYDTYLVYDMHEKANARNTKSLELIYAFCYPFGSCCCCCCCSLLFLSLRQVSDFDELTVLCSFVTTRCTHLTLSYIYKYTHYYCVDTYNIVCTAVDTKHRPEGPFRTAPVVVVSPSWLVVHFVETKR